MSKKVAVIMGSDSDFPVVKSALTELKKYGVEFECRVMSAHRTPAEACEFASKARENGFGAVICAAGMAAHLAGAVAARTIKPVIGIPVSGGLMGGLDALLSTVQMPPGFPVGTVAMDKAGARNAAWMAAQILALQDPALADRIRAARAKMQADVEKAAAEVEAAH